MSNQQKADGDTAKLKEYLLKYESLFSWDNMSVDWPMDKYIKNLLQKCQVIDEEHQFHWTRFIPHLILSYVLCKEKKDHTQALQHINWCQDHWSTLESTCKESLFLALREVVALVILVTKAHILLAAGKPDLARQELNLMSKNSMVMSLHSTKNRAGLLGLKAAVYLQYQPGAADYSSALKAAEEARDLDPDQAEWWFIIGLSLGRTRKIREIGHFQEPTTKEIDAIEKAFALQKDASYTVHLGQVYADYSILHFNCHKEKSLTYAKKANERFREALQIRPNCANLKARVAHGMVRIRCKEVTDMEFIKKLLHEVVESSPGRIGTYMDLGYIYSTIEKDDEKAITYLQKAYDSEGYDSIKYLAEHKWKKGLEHEIIEDVEKGLSMYHQERAQSLLNTYLGVCHIILNNDWAAVIPCFQKALDLDPTAQFLTRFRDFNGKFVNLLDLIFNHLYFSTAEDQEMVKPFLARISQLETKKIKPKKTNRFVSWIKGMERQRGCNP